MIEDAELLRRYAEEKSEGAFAELVQRHLGLVYACALRRVAGDAQMAEDVTQLVFTDVARHAVALRRQPVLAGWLFTSTRFAAAKAMRTARRRLEREQKAYIMQQLSQDVTMRLYQQHGVMQ
jgi:DNA-directed RNA polymerase specialized sigma24 family protein